nr:unnamed protein product [uncultured Mediterranean phage uvMED]
MASAPVDIPIKVKGLSDLQKLEKRMEALERDIAKLNKQLPTAENGIRKTGRAAGTATGNIQRMGVAFRTTLGPIVALYGAFTFLNRSLDVASQRQVDVAKLSNGLRNLGATASDLERLTIAADNFGNATLFDQEDATQAFALLTSFQRIGVDSYERVTKAASDLATVTGQDLKSAQIQLAKALEDPTKRVTDLARSGTVFTDQQKEQIKVLQESGDLLGAQNLILKELEKQYGGAAEAAGSAGLAGAFDSLGEATRDFQEALASSQGFIDGVTAAVNLLTDAVKGAQTGLQNAETIVQAITILANEAGVASINFGKGIDFVKEAILNALPQLRVYLWALEQVNKLAGKVVDSKAGPRNFGDNYASQERALFEAAGGSDPYKALKPKSQGGGGGGGSSSSGAAADKAAKEAQRQAEAAAKQLKAAQDLVFESENRLRLLKEMEPLEKLQEEAAVKKLEIERSYAEKLAESMSATETLALQMAQQNELKASELDLEQQIAKLKDGATSGIKDEIAFLEAKIAGKEEEYRLTKAIKDLEAGGVSNAEATALVNRRAELERQYETVQGLEQQYQSLASGIAGSMTDAFTSIIDGTKSAEEAFSGMLKQMGKMFIDFAMKILQDAITQQLTKLFAGLFGGGGFGGFGGGSMGSGLPLNGFAEGGRPPVGQYSLVGENGPELVKFDNAATVYSNQDSRGMLNQYSPSGGGMGGGGGTIRFESTVINGVEYVTRGEAEAIGQRAAEQGARGGHVKSMRTLQNSRSQRAKLGIK